MPIALAADFTILYEDESLLLVDKAAPLLAHPTGAKMEPTLWHGLQELLRYELLTGGQISLINRLDRETSGIVLVAKTAAAARALGCAMQQRLFAKSYLAVVRGCPPWFSARCEEPILRMMDVAESLVRVRQCCHPQGKPCRTDVELLRTMPASGLSLLSCRPHTGRMHQIRVHLAQLGYPIVGDKIYGGDGSCYLDFMEQGWTESLAEKLLLPRHALHASALSFPHPLTGEMIKVEAPLPADMIALMEEGC